MNRPVNPRAIGTIYRRALARVTRRARAYVADPTPANRELLREACALANDLAR